MIKTLAKEVGKSLLKNTGKVVTGVLILGLGSALARSLRPISDREGKRLYKFVYDEEVPTPQKGTTRR